MTQPIAVLLAKSDSRRFPNKNWREFYDGKSLVDIKIEQVLKAFEPEKIYLSCDDPDRVSVAKKHGIRFSHRDTKYATSHVELSDVILNSVNVDIPGPPDQDVLILHATCPLVHDFQDIWSFWEHKKAEGHDSLFVTTELQKYVVDEDLRPVNYHWGRWHSPSENLPKWGVIECGTHIINRQTLDDCAYYIGRNPCAYQHHLPSIDIDYEHEFEIAQKLYEEYCI